MSLELIHWMDHSSFTENRWHGFDDFDNQPMKCQTAGWVIKEDKHALTIVATASENEKHLGDMTIVKKAILNRWKLRDPGKAIREENR